MASFRGLLRSPTSRPLHLSVSPSTLLSTHPPVHLPLCPSTYLSAFTCDTALPQTPCGTLVIQKPSRPGIAQVQLTGK